jgi:two-component system, sensor histidine kinase and response regulator
MVFAPPLTPHPPPPPPPPPPPRLYQSTSQRLLDANGVVLGTVSITRDITEQSQLEDALQERVKELRCLYAVFKATENMEQPLHVVLREVCHLLPPGMYYPEIAVASVEIDDTRQVTGDLSRAVARLDVNIVIDGVQRGRVSIAYLEDRPARDEGPFLDEEHRLAKAVAERLGAFLQACEAARQLKRAKRFAEQVIESSNVMVLGLDARGRVLFLNAAGQAVTGYAEQELVGQDWFSVLLRFEADAATREVFARAIAAEEAVAALENTLWTKCGEARRILWTSNIVLNPEGERIFVSFGIDVTEQRKAEAALDEHQQNLEKLVAARTAEVVATSESLRSLNDEQQAIFDAATAGIVLLRERVVIRCNRTMETMLGYGPGELLGRSSRTWFTDEASFLEVGRKVEQAFAAGDAYRDEVEIVRKDGSRFWSRLHAGLVDRGDPSKGVAGMLRDITPERAAVEEIKRARAVAEEAARAKADFLANMSHEIRTPMNAIIGMSHLVLQTALTPRQRDYLAKIQGASEHLLGIINDILDFSKSEAGKLELEQADFKLETMLTNVTTLLSEKTHAKALEIVLDVAPEVPPVLIGDELRIRQVLLNFCSNAVKFTERGEVDIAVRLLERGEREALLEFAVRDTGIGISEDEKSRLFQSFQQADTSTSRRYGGTGLGLIISKRLIELMHGEIGVDSAAGEGSTFWFRVRLGIGRAQAQLPTPDLRGARLLVVDDNGTARTVLKDMLTRMGFVVDQATSGAAALECVRQAAQAGRGYAVVFLDWRMPGMDGVETAQRIRLLDLATPPHCVMVTAHGHEELMQAAMASGVTTVLLKPVSASPLFDTLVKVLGGQAYPPAEAALPTVNGRADLAELRGARILLVEDNELNQEVAKAMLESLGLIVDVAENGAVALGKVQEVSYDLVFMDMQMPVMDGLAATRAIRRLPGTGVVPIVAMTANVLQQDRERCFEAGMNDYLGKPIEPVLLTAALKRWVKPRDITPGPAGVRADEVAGLALDVEGLDVDGALRRVAGNAPFLLSLLRRFVDGNRHAVADIAQSLEAGDRAGAERRAHTLKGVAATLGATRLQQAVSDLEAALHADPDSAETSQRLATLGAVLVSLCAALDRQLPGAVAAVEADAQPTA